MQVSPHARVPDTVPTPCMDALPTVASVPLAELPEVAEN